MIQIFALLVCFLNNGYIFFLLKPDRIVFPGDYFGQMSPNGWHTFASQDKESLVKEIAKFHEGLGYTKEEVKKHLGILKKLDLTMIAPSHGSVINRHVDEIVEKVIEHKLRARKKGGLWSIIFGR